MSNISDSYKSGKDHGNYDHGHTSQGISPTYSVWESMKKRCLNPKSSNFDRYGAKGVTICEDWMDFRNFLEDMGERPTGMTLDRIDNSKGYYKENCRWADLITQSNNRSNNRRFEYLGKTMTIAEWAKEFGLSHKIVHQRIYRDGMNIEQALTKKRSRW
jgi:hypothetical protein